MTHTGIESKTQSSGTLTMPSSGTVEVQVQPMTLFTSGSTFYWSVLIFEVDGTVTTPTPGTPVTGPAMPVASPTQAPDRDSTSNDVDNETLNARDISPSFRLASFSIRSVLGTIGLASAMIFNIIF